MIVHSLNWTRSSDGRGVCECCLIEEAAVTEIERVEELRQLLAQHRQKLVDRHDVEHQYRVAVALLELQLEVETSEQCARTLGSVVERSDPSAVQRSLAARWVATISVIEALRVAAQDLLGPLRDRRI